MPLESGDFPVLSFFITVCISSSVAISIGVPFFSEFSSISFCNGQYGIKNKDGQYEEAVV
jgi:hypothetical protein